MDRYDENKNGVLEKDEWSKSRSDISGADTNKDSQITRDEYTAYMQARMGSGGFGSPGGGPSFMGFGGPSGGDGGFSFRRDDGDRGSRSDGGRDDRRDGGRDSRDGSRDSGGSSFYSKKTPDVKSSSNSASTASKGPDRKSYRELTPIERLPKGLPEWFARNDANADGQVAMAEYSASWSNSTAKEFAQFDINNDGMITAKECLEATDAGIARGASSSSGSSSSSSPKSNSSSRTSSLSSTPAAEQTSAPSTSPSTATTMPETPAAEIKIDSKTMAHFQGVIKKNDKDGDGVLTKDEWVSMSKDPTAADKDKDGKITPTEYAAWTLSK